ncbi:MAG: fatty acid desaturase [Bdellovibrionales bacterium]|nr:fatty acid desaturase [Bdellovibrionales bacterium]
MRQNLTKSFRILWAVAEPLLAFALLGFLVTVAFGSGGLFPNALATGAWWKIAIYLALMTHVTITAMSLSFHRQYTHQGVVFSKWVDRPMQAWLALTTGMSKRDWVSVHIYHHAHSDQDLDPHSPKHKGLARIFFLGVYDYVVAKSWPDVVKLRKKIPEDRYEKVLNDNPVIGPIFTASALTIAFGPVWGGFLSVMTFAISPLFAVGGVNALAHAIGYRNYQTTDESRNIGFLFPLNWMICGELDHNNHHAHPRSCSFRHRWYEFDIGYFYIRALSAVGLAQIKTAHSLKKAAAKSASPDRSPHNDSSAPTPPARPESLYA